MPLIARHPTPYVAAKSASPLDYAFVAGPAAVIVLNAYAGASGLPAQAEWLRGALSRVERAKTPWLIVVFHTPWYSSNNARSYTRAGEPLRWAVEHILFEAGVDIVLSGHIHAYERSHPVFNRTRTACGPTHLCVGDAGCVLRVPCANPALPAVHCTVAAADAAAVPPHSAHGGPMVGWKLPAPDWSAFRSASFGAGKLVLVNECVRFAAAACLCSAADHSASDVRTALLRAGRTRIGCGHESRARARPTPPTPRRTGMRSGTRRTAAPAATRAPWRTRRRTRRGLCATPNA